MTRLSLSRIVADELALIAPQPVRSRTVVSPIRRTVWSARWPGFGIRLYASGKRIWVVQAQMGGRTRTVTIGDARIITKAQASDVARRVLLRVQVGDNPAKDRVVARKAPRYEGFFEEYWSKVSLRWKPSTLERNIYYRKRHLDRAFPGKFINQISEADVLRWFSQISNNHGPAAANRVLEILRAMFNRAEAWGVLPEGSNPCNEIKRNKLRKHECWLSDEELARFGTILERIKEDDPMSVAAIQLIMLTGCRKSEITKLCWSEVKGRRLLLHDAKTGPRTVWLGHPAEQLLASLPRHETLEQVFWRGDKPLSLSMLEHQYGKARAEAGLKHVRLHDLRHSFASHAAMQAETLPMIGKLLGHSRIQSTARYAHLDDSVVLEAAEQVGNVLAANMIR